MSEHANSMAKVDLIEPALPHVCGSSTENKKSVGKIPKSDFGHVSHGNFKGTQKAIESFLVSKEEHRQGHVAELIMFMERSFAGKYMKGERFHYQRIMASDKWRKGDTLSEKLTRCKDKETFKKRFDRIGTTAILRRSNFHDNEIKISESDFKERMYLRLIDTEQNNISMFYRNDAVVDAFIKSAIAYYREKTKAEKYKTRSALARKPAVVGGGKPEVVYLENPKPLLYTKDLQERGSGKNKGNLLRLVHSSTTEKNQHLPRNGLEDKEASGFGFDDKQAAIAVGLIPDTKENDGALQHTSSAKSLSGFEVFKLWRKSVLAKHPDEFISEEPTGKLIGQAAIFFKRFNEFYPVDSIADFFDHLAENWVTACKDYKDRGIWQKLGKYPEISNLLEHSNHILTSYMQQKQECSNKAIPVPEIEHFIPNPPRPYKGCDLVLSNGCTPSQYEMSLEYLIATHILIRIRLNRGKNYVSDGENYENKFRGEVKESTIDILASEARILELTLMPESEFIKYCC